VQQCRSAAEYAWAHQDCSAALLHSEEPRATIPRRHRLLPRPCTHALWTAPSDDPTPPV